MKDSHKNLILQKITGLDKEQLFLNKIPLTENQQRGHDRYIERLESGESIEYVLENAEFYGLDFFVDSRVLIPRNDTEIMIDEALKVQGDTYIDVGTGSGCIPISVVNNTQDNFDQVYAVDISEKSLEVAKINIKNHNLTDKIELLQSDLLEKILEKDLQNKQILITANLPYIKQGDFENMDSGVCLHEPELALYGGEKTGFELYEKLIGQCLKLKKQGNKITLLIEIGFDQKQVCEEYLNSQGLKFEIFEDKGGVERCVRIILK